MRQYSYFTDPLRWIEEGRRISARVIPPGRPSWRVSHVRDPSRKVVLRKMEVAAENWDLLRPSNDRVFL